MSMLAGLDIGGTTCAVSLGRETEAGLEILAKRRFPTPDSPARTLDRFRLELADLLTETDDDPKVGASQLAAIGVSCGGPLDSTRGLILSPPNLPGWDRIDVVTPFAEAFGVPVAVQNDADAGALAEWQWGAGRGCRHMVFLTFGTGMGAGLILNGRLYTGATGGAGEVGHVRLANDGPVGFGKAGSFEGFCSGGGIAQLGRQAARRQLEAGAAPAFCPTPDDLDHVTAETIGRAAQGGDALAREVYRIVGERLGQGLALLVDMLNPERIIIGSIYGRQIEILESTVLRVLRSEALPASLAACEVMPAGLGEHVGDYAALAVAQQLMSRPDGAP